MSISDRYNELLRTPKAELERVAHMHNVFKGRLICAILQHEYDKATYNAWATDHGVPLMP